MYVCTQGKDSQNKAAEMLKKANIANPDDQGVSDLASGLRAFKILATTTMDKLKSLFVDEQP
jgi:ABC-type cobalamin/Fe3+-siderophores transport system ATPase subunit